jgi:tetratricopeptide (TPR) repeat protein
MAIAAFGTAGSRRQQSISVALVVLTFAFSLPTLLKAQSADPAPPPQSQTPIGTSGAVSPPQITLSPEELGDLHMARRRYQAAIQAYHQVPRMTPVIWNKIGMANQQMFILEEAKKNYETALKMDPKNADVLNNLGTVHYSLKEYGSAERFYRKALKINPKSALVYKNLGTALLAENRFKKGWDCYQAALAIDPDIFERNYQYRIGEPTPAQKRGAMNYYLAKSYVRVGMTERAVDYLRMAIDEGFTDRKKVLADKEFASLHGVSAFEQLISEQRMQ